LTYSFKGDCQLAALSAESVGASFFLLIEEDALLFGAKKLLADGSVDGSIPCVGGTSFGTAALDDDDAFAYGFTSAASMGAFFMVGG
jgi:hypothetical protein